MTSKFLHNNPRVVFDAAMPDRICRAVISAFAYEPLDDHTAWAMNRHLRARWPGPNWSVTLDLDGFEVRMQFDTDQERTIWLLKNS